MLAETLDAILGQTMPDAVYWMESPGEPPKRVTLNAAPVNVAEGLRTNLFEKLRSVVMCERDAVHGGARQAKGSAASASPS